MFKEDIGKIAVPCVGSLLSFLIGELILRRTADDGKPSVNLRAAVGGIAVAILVGLFFVMRQFNTPDGPSLQSIDANPNYGVKKGDDIVLVVRLDRPAPKHGISVFLSSSDQSILTTNGNAIIEEGQVMGTGYFKAVGVPNYRSPIKIVATYKEDQVNTQVSFATSISLEPVPGGNTISRQSARPLLQTKADSHLKAPQAVAMVEQPKAPAALDPELVSRLEEVQGRFGAEKNYWDNVKEHMPQGSSIRSEITSQIYAAQSTSGRCAREEQAKDAVALSSCVEALNDHLNQLKLQH